MKGQGSRWELFRRKTGKEVYLDMGMIEEQIPKMMFNIRFLVST